MLIDWSSCDCDPNRHATPTTTYAASQQRAALNTHASSSPTAKPEPARAFGAFLTGATAGAAWTARCGKAAKGNSYA